MKGSVLQMLYHARELNKLMERQDYDQDGQGDCVGVHVSGVGVIKSATSFNNILDTNTSSLSPQTYLKTFSQYQLDGYCLAILFSSRMFPGKVLGLSWRAANTTRAGICQTRSNVGSTERPELLNLNSLFITMRTQHMARIPLRMGVLNLAHEVHHSLGAEHDPESGQCAGRFLMSRYSGSGVHQESGTLQSSETNIKIGGQARRESTMGGIIMFLMPEPIIDPFTACEPLLFRKDTVKGKKCP